MAETVELATIWLVDLLGSTRLATAVGPVRADSLLGEYFALLHWRLAAVSVDRSRAAGYSLRAGQRALDSLAPSDAAKLFGDALEMLGSAPSAARSEALIGLGEAQRQTGVPAYRETLLEAAGIAAELRDADLAARAALANNRGFVSSFGDVDRDRVAAIERALELDDPPQPARHARLLALLTKELAFEPDRARRRALGDEAIALARQASDPRTLATALESSCYAIWAPDTLATRSERARELSALVAQVGDLQVEFLARVRELSVAIELGDFGWADAALERAEAIAEHTRQPTQRWNASFLAASVLCTRGELEASERLAEQAFQLGQEAGHSDAAAFYAPTIVQIRLVQGQRRGGDRADRADGDREPGVAGLGGRARLHVLPHRPPPRSRGDPCPRRRAALRTPPL